ncbi:C40 family peptidase [Cohnella sp. AR92]|uniref:C40 family peptidase n=1 Tax=Cohnella sp. AR92 TaxID=648716 RepID=UPI000F8D6B29|nr:C40 family peptidase [Cohnella sp. AR92]RUS43577.1 hypothetical protein ELR57_24940 [Cohnella sp. AR92]
MDKNKRLTKRMAAAVPGTLMLSLAIALSGCAANNNESGGNVRKYSAPVRIKTLEQTKAEENGSPSVVPVKVIQNSEYVALGDVARAMGFHAMWLRDGHYGIGDNDAAWKFKPGMSSAMVGDENVKLPAPTIKESNRLYVPVKGLKKLFGDVATFRADSETVSFYPHSDHILRNGIKAQAVNPHGGWEHRNEHGPQAEELLPGTGGAEAPNTAGGPTNLSPDESFGNAAAEESANPSGTNEGAGSSSEGQTSNASNGTAEATAVITEAKKYLGVKYEFGAGDYKDTGRFDCSSFVQFLFAKEGITMPRAARDQAELGTKVSRDQLKKGDLMYFYVPGRFKSDSTVGHVGIYMGDGNMIHASPASGEGVQITPIDKPYWARTYLYAKRVLPE